MLVLSLRKNAHSYASIKDQTGLGATSIARICIREGLGQEVNKKPKKKVTAKSNSKNRAVTLKDTGSLLLTKEAETLNKSFEDKLQDTADNILETITPEKIENLEVVAAVKSINSLIDTKVKLIKTNSDKSVNDSITAVLAHASRLSEEKMIDFPAIETSLYDDGNIIDLENNEELVNEQE